MSKLTKDELVAKVNEKIQDQDLAIELIEDITDSMEVDTSEKDILQAEIESTKAELENLKTKYKERFLNSNSEESKEELKEESNEDDEVIDVKEIF